MLPLFATRQRITDQASGRWVPLFPSMGMLDAGDAATGLGWDVVAHAYARMIHLAAPAPAGMAVPPTFRWVPTEPTPAMVEAGAVVDRMGDEQAQHLYAIMTTQAPTPNMGIAGASRFDQLIDASSNVRRLRPRPTGPG